MSELRLFLLCFVEFYVLSVATPSNWFGSRLLGQITVDEPVFTTGEDRLNKADRAQSIEEVLGFLFPEEDPREAFKSLVIKEVNDDVASSPMGRVGFWDVGDGDNWVTRPATVEDYDLLGEQHEFSKCRTPVNVTVNAYEEFGINPGLGTHLWPDCITVPRCIGESGCCVEGEICMGVEEDKVMLPKLFLVYTEIDNHIAVRNFTSYKSCSCQPDPFYNGADVVTDTKCTPIEPCSLPKIWNEESCTCDCPKSCPSPYAQDPDSCVCDCLHSNKFCGKVKRGMRPLPSEGCQCVVHNDCAEPACRSGYFDDFQCSCIPYS